MPTSSWTDTAVGTATTADPSPGNNTATLVVPVSSVADLTVSKVASAVQGTSGGTLSFFFYLVGVRRDLPSFPTRRSSDLAGQTLISASGNNGTTTVAGASAAATVAT